MFNSEIWRPGAVDVDDGMGLTRHGMVQDLIPSTGLIIDFGYPDHHADLIPFIQCTTQPGKSKITKPKNVETLFQRSPDQPWYWYPSKLLAGSLDTYAFVEIDFDGEVFRDVIPLEKVRPMRKDSRFRKHEVGLPEKEELLNAAKEKGFLPMWNRVTKTVGVKIDGGRLTYVSQRPSPMPGDVVEKHIRTIVDNFTLGKHVPGIVDDVTLNEVQEDVRTDQEKEPEPTDHDNPQQHASQGQKRVADGDIISGSEAAPKKLKTIDGSTCEISWSLPVDILMKIFAFLNVDDQIHSRAVCSTWNAILTSIPASFRIQIDLSESNYEKLATALHKMVTKSTKILVVTGSHNEATRNPVHIVYGILKAKGIKVGTIVIARRSMWADDILDYSDGKLKIRSAWSAICDQLVLEDVEVCAVLGGQNISTWKVLRARGYQSYRQRRPDDLVLPLTGRIQVGKEEGLMGTLGLFEAACPKMSVENQTVLQEQWQNFGQDNAPALEIRQRLLKGMHFWQPSDPQSDAAAEWSVEKLESLREVTKHAVLFQSRHDLQIRMLDVQRIALGMMGIGQMFDGVH